MVTMLLLALLGILSAGVLAATGVRFEPTRRDAQPTLFQRVLGIVLLAAACLLALVLLLPGLAPFSFSLAKGGLTAAEMRQVPQAAAGSLSTLFSNFKQFTQGVHLQTALPNTLLPILISLITAFPITYLAALGIGGLRPLGKGSEWLLLLFAPWLFVGYASFAPVFLQNARSLHLLNTFAGLINPFWLNIPALFLLVLYFKGRAQVWEMAVAGGKSVVATFFTKVVLPSLPFAALLVFFQIGFGMQDLMQPLAIATQVSVMPLQIALLANYFRQADPQVLLAGIGVIWLVLAALFFGVIGLFQLFYIDRVALGPLADN